MLTLVKTLDQSLDNWPLLYQQPISAIDRSAGFQESLFSGGEEEKNMV